MAIISSYNFLFIKILNYILCYLLISRYVRLKNGILKFETCFDTINYLWHNHILITQCVTILQRQMVSSKDLLNAMVYKGLLHLSYFFNVDSTINQKKKCFSPWIQTTIFFKKEWKNVRILISNYQKKNSWTMI